MRFDQESQTVVSEGHWWRPPLIGDVVDSHGGDRLLYVAVDDLDVADVTLVGYPWPKVSEAGTLFFGEPNSVPGSGEHQPEQGSGVWLTATDAGEVVTRIALQTAVTADRLAESNRYTDHRPESGLALDRPIRVGDVFAVASEEPIQAALDPTTGRWEAQVDLSAVEVYDITFESREVSRAAFLAAIAPPLKKAVFDQEKKAFEEAAQTHEEGVSGFESESEADGSVSGGSETVVETTHQASPDI